MRIMQAGAAATWGWWWRAGMTVAWTCYLALAYTLARGAAGGWSGIGTVLLGITGALAAAVFLLPLVAFLDLDDVIASVRASRRYRRGECPACGQPRAGSMSPCPECGAAFERPLQWVPTWTTAGRLAVAIAVSLALGSTAAEWRLRADEDDFRRVAAAQALAAGSPAWDRARPWPADFAVLGFDAAESRFSAPPPFEFPRIPGWQPRR